jgi:hypothetical protein
MNYPKDIDFNTRLKAFGLKIFIITLIILVGELKSCSGNGSKPVDNTVAPAVGNFFIRQIFTQRKKRKSQFAVIHACVANRRAPKQARSAGYNRYR